jgi:hopene-associated glycosyltransferase HpnB
MLRPELVQLTVDGIAALAAAVWLYLLLGRGMFWLGRERDDTPSPMPNAWPRIVAVVPARNEAEGIGETITSLLRQDYPGGLSVVLVDDESTDGTADVARTASAALGEADRLQVISGRALPRGWTGKLWAVKQGIAVADGLPQPPDYLLLTDADIVYAPDTLRWLASHATAKDYVLTSLMAKLNCESFAERALVPAFIFFFQMLYPFGWVKRREAATAAAAGGCMLVKAETLRTAGGIEVIRGALIDDCTLAATLKRHGPIWLGLTERVRSIRPYPKAHDIRRMVARSAYAQLRYSPLLLAGTVLGMALTYLAPPLLAIVAGGFAQLAGLAAYALMAIAFVPTLRFYRLSPAWALALPAIAFWYMLYTLDSAYQYARGRGGRWKGRVQAHVTGR